jgi:hypothetical protein
MRVKADSDARCAWGPRYLPTMHGTEEAIALQVKPPRPQGAVPRA